MFRPILEGLVVRHCTASVYCFRVDSSIWRHSRRFGAFLQVLETAPAAQSAGIAKNWKRICWFEGAENKVKWSNTSNSQIHTASFIQVFYLTTINPTLLFTKSILAFLLQISRACPYSKLEKVLWSLMTSLNKISIPRIVGKCRERATKYTLLQTNHSRQNIYLDQFCSIITNRNLANS